MSKSSITVWQGGRLLDDQPVVRPWSFVLGVCLLLAMLDAILAWALPVPVDVELRDATGLRRQLEIAAAEPERPSWLLIGDSVLAGDVMRGRVEDWSEHRVLDEARRAMDPDDRTRLHQIGLDALLPLDILHVVRELDAVDPTGRVAVAIELNPRYFSPTYRNERTCTRPWLCEVGLGALFVRGTPQWPRISAWLRRSAKEAITRALPIHRHRWRVRLDGWPVERALGPPPEGDDDALSARARMLAHYRDLALDPRSVQIRALRATVAALRARGRRAVFFTTPLADEFLAEAMSPEEYGAYVATMSAIIEPTGAGSDDPVGLINLDHPLLSDELFLDHCHLGPEGNRRLAVNLLAELGIGLADVPDDDELIHREGPDGTLVTRADVGYSDGAAWQALLQHPEGLAVAPGGGRVVIADTGNHCLREITGSMQTVRTLAGSPGQAGRRDGRAREGRLSSPRFPVLVGDDVYFVDQKKRKRLVRLHAGVLSTVKAPPGPAAWTRIDALVADGDRLLMLDGGRRILIHDLTTGQTDVVLSTGEGWTLGAMASAGGERVFVADQDDRIWEVEHFGAELGDTPRGVHLEFANDATDVIPQIRGLYFPLDYDQMRFANIVGMTWVERYGGLLVQDDIPAEHPIEGLSERIALRMLQVDEDRIYPWLKPLVHGGGYMLYNRKSRSFVSYFHEGSMALEPRTATLFYLERQRSRLVYLADGIMGVAKIGHIRDLVAYGFRDLLGVASGTATLDGLRPDRFLHDRIERVAREGPYVGVIIGSSMLSKSDIIGSYSFGVRLENRLRKALGLRDRIRLDVIQRTYPGVRSEKVLQELRSLVEAGARPDVIFIELSGARNRFFETDQSEERMRAVLAEVDDIARRHDSLVVFFDDAGLVSIARDGLRPTHEPEKRFKELARATGFEVVDLTDELLRDSIDLSPFGSPPWRSHHATPWAVDAAADLLADRIYPRLREFLRGRVPALHRSAESVETDDEALRDAFSEVAADWPSLTPSLGNESVQNELVGDRLDLFVDLRRLSLGEHDEHTLADVAAAAMHQTIALGVAGMRARTVRVRLAEFRRYDEYGDGVRDAADVRWDRTFDRAALIAFLQEVRARRGGG